MCTIFKKIALSFVLAIALFKVCYTGGGDFSDSDSKCRPNCEFILKEHKGTKNYYTVFLLLKFMFLKFNFKFYKMKPSIFWHIEFIYLIRL